MFKLISYDHKPALLAESTRILPEQRIEGLFYYEIRHGDDPFKPYSLEESVVVNFWGTLITHQAITAGKFVLSNHARHRFMFGGEQLDGTNVELHLKQFRSGIYECPPDELLPSISKEDLQELQTGDVVRFRLVNRGTVSGTIDEVIPEEGGYKIKFRNRLGFIHSIAIASMLSHQRLVDVRNQHTVIITVDGGVADVFHCPPNVQVKIVDFDNGDSLDD